MDILLGYFVVGLELMLLVSGVHLLWASRAGRGVTDGGRKPRRQEKLLQILMHFLVWAYAMGGWGFEEVSAAVQLIHWYRRLTKKKIQLQHFISAWPAELGECCFRQNVKAEALLLCSSWQYLPHSNCMWLSSGLGKTWSIFLPHWCVRRWDVAARGISSLAFDGACWDRCVTKKGWN